MGASEFGQSLGYGFGLGIHPSLIGNIFSNNINSKIKQ